MTQVTLLELAKKGDDTAILSVMNYVLKDRNMTAQAALKGTCLLVLLKAAQIPDQKLSVTIVRKLMTHLSVPSIASVQIYGKQAGQPAPAWMEIVDLRDHITPSTEKTGFFQRLIQWRVKPLLIFGLIPLGIVGIYGCWSLFRDRLTVPVPIELTSLQTKAVSPRMRNMAQEQAKPTVSSSPNSPALGLSSYPEPFQEAVNQAMGAATLTQSAQTPADWRIVVSHWQEAIALMNTVPPSHLQHSLAQQKVLEYQQNLNYAQKNAATDE